MSDYVDRRIKPLPQNHCVIRVKRTCRIEKITEIFTCVWQPNTKSSLKELIGTAKVLEGPCAGIGFNVWEDSDREFIEYKIITEERV